MSQEKHERLEKSLSPGQVWALALGSIVGWGCFVLPGDSFLPNAGPLATLIGFWIGAILLCFVAITYSYMIEYTPVAGGEYAYAFVGFGPNAAFICGWALVLGYISIIAINISALALIVRFLFPGVFEFGELYTIVGWKVYTGEVILMCAAVVFFAALNYRGVSFAGTLQIILAFCLSGGILILFAGTVSLDTADFSKNLIPLFSEKQSYFASVLVILAIAPFLFVGFDTVPQAAEEFSFPPKKARNIMLMAILWGAVLYSLVTLSVSVAIPYPEMLQKMSELREAGKTAWATGEVSKMAFGDFGAIVLACAVLGAVCTGINGFFVATTRLLLSMARGRILPSWFAQIHPKFHTPHKAIVFSAIFVLLTPWCGRAVVGWIVEMSSVGTGIAYLFTSLAAWKVVSANKTNNAAMKLFVCVVGCIAALICLGLLVIPGSPALIGLAPRWILLVWVLLGIFFYVTNRSHWTALPESELRASILGDENTPVFYKK